MLKLIAAFLIGLVQNKEVCARCPTGIDELHGVVYYTTTNWEKCNWTFMGQNMQSDVILSIKFIETYYLPRNSLDFLLLPNNEHLYTSDRYISSSANPWCGLYVKENNGRETTCRAGIELAGKCRNKPETVVSKNWPPRMTTRLGKVAISYAFLECPQADKVYPPTTTTPPSKKEREVNCKQALTTTTNLSASSSTQSSVHATPVTNISTTVAITFGVVLVITFVIIFTLVIKIRTVTRKSNNSDPVYADIGAVPHSPIEIGSTTQSNNQASGSRKEMVNNEIYVFAESVL